MDILVYGGAGFIGKHLCSRLVFEGHRVRVFNMLPASGKWPDIPGVEWLAGDFTNPVEAASALGEADVIFHLVSTTLPKNSNDNPVRDLNENVVSTVYLLDNIVASKKKPKVIFISSGGTVYGIPNVTPIPETHSTNPICSYGISKLAIEKYLLLYRYLHGIDYVVLRMANPYGEYQPVHSGQGVIPVFLSKALRGDALDIWGDGTVVRDYLYIDDAIDSAVMAIGYSGSERVFNIGSGKGYSLNELVQMIGKLLGRPVVCHHSSARSFDVPINVLDITLARKELGWLPKTQLELGLKNMLNYLNLKQDSGFD